MISTGVQACIEQERRDCRLLLFLTAAGALSVALSACILRRCDRQQPPIDLEKVKEQWRQEAGNTNRDQRGVAGPLPPYLERLSTNLP
jgi:hypothetical protein